MSEPLDLERVERRLMWGLEHEGRGRSSVPNHLVDALLFDDKRLRGELARRDEQIAAVRALIEGLHQPFTRWGEGTADRETLCMHEGHPWPCPTIRHLNYEPAS